MAQTGTHPDHTSNLVALKRIEGQIRGLQKMIAEKRYCVDILTQINSVSGALGRVQNNILTSHLNHCFTDAMKGKSDVQKQQKVDEVVALLKRVRKSR